MEEIDKDPKPKTCDSCGESFGCGAELDSCWCFAVELSADTSADLKTKYRDCLCPECLRRLSEAKTITAGDFLTPK